jgi:hypothetical protein
MGTCSIHKFLDQGAGTVEMLQASLKWVCTKFPDIDEIHLTDKSYVPINDDYSMALPEYSMLAYGKTWYQRHFGAILDARSPTTQKIIEAYQRLRIRAVQETRLTDFVSNRHHNKKVHEVIANVFKQKLKTDQDTRHLIRTILGLPPMTGTTWVIPRDTIMSYPVQIAEEQSQQGGRRHSAFVNQMNFYRKPYYLKKD